LREQHSALQYFLRKRPDPALSW